jgi:ATP phosphoribosyltransferase regulatory subunit
MPTLNELIKINNDKNQRIQKVKDVFFSYGYAYVEPEYIENYNTFKTQNPSIDDKNIVKLMLTDGIIYTLRPDITTNLIKQYVPLLSHNEVLKVCYQASYFRQNSLGLRIQPQLGFEVFGPVPMNESLNLLSDVSKLLRSKMTYVLGYPSYIRYLLSQYHLNDTLFELAVKAIRLKSVTQLISVIPQLQEDDLVMNHMTTLYSKQTLPKDFIDYLKRENISIFKDIVLDYVIDLSLIPQYDYYSGMYLEGYLKGYSKPLALGGSYDKRCALYGKDTQAFGMSFDVDVLSVEVTL